MPLLCRVAQGWLRKMLRTWWATLTGPAPPLTGKNCLISLCHFLLFAFLAFDNVLVLLFIFQGREDWLRKLLWCWPFICPRDHDTWETLELPIFGCLRRRRGPISMSSYYNTMGTRRHCEGFT
jgi:hypothetical protein